ncbi:MAG TPA: LysR family transcriptional regulator [Candidatus Egerieimonas intestinavium]|uniref:LysR family transcriptional regulator n=1 Tax=Candidatus Egerieimonas intestinavium TaxID=2840777 RepID=A0A9D1EL91_9FIRM|nr:LysR family transcriptional regulator [Candidatus Egerieimonas intestinavium]
MDVQDLEYFKMICQEKSITKAAHSLYITPQGLSKTVKNLEFELGTALLNRTASGVTLTEAGQYLADHLQEFLDVSYSLKSGIREISKRQRHEIDLLSAYGILRLVTPECLWAFRQKHPEITLNYREYPDKQVERLFAAQEGNVAFTIGPADFGSLRAAKLESFSIKLLVNREHPLSRRSSVTIGDLQGEPLFLESSEFWIHHFIVDKCRAAGFEPNIVFETSGFSLCHKMVKQNKGISVTVDFIFDDMQDESLALIPFSDGTYRWSTYMLTRKDSSPNPDIELFCSHVLDWMKAIKEHRISR